MPISAQQWRLAVGQANASRSLRPCVTGQPKMKLISWDVLLFVLTSLLGAILLGAILLEAILSKDGGKETSEKKCVSRGSGGGGTVGELAPSLLTAPRRKELLMLAGDIESNPGPYTDYTFARLLRWSDLELVVEELKGVEKKWESIGREVFTSAFYGYPTDIRTSHSTSHDCMRKVLRKRLQDPRYTTWGHIIVAVRKAGEPQLADNLKAKYIPDLLEESDLDLLTQELTEVKLKWYEIGVDLGLKDEVKNIHRQYSDLDVCLRETLRAELQHPQPTTWRNIVDALRSPGVRESQLADQLEAKYCPKLTSVSLVAQELTAVCEKWQDIGEELGVKQSSLRDIHIDYSDRHDCLREMLSERFQSCTTSWKDIVAVLRTPRIGESRLADHLDVKYCSTAQQILQDALEKGYVDCHIWKVLVTGAAGSGKTTLKHRLFGEEPPSLRCSTALAEAAIRAISREIVGTSVTGWFRVTYEELMGMLGGALKAGIPMEQSPSGAGVATGVTAHKEPTKVYTTHETKQPKIATAAGPVSTSPNPFTETTAAPLPVPTSKVSAQVSSSKQELIQLVEKSKGSKRFLELQWIHFIDSGGQPQFHEVLPAFIRNTTATIFVMKLSERLDEHPMIEYFDKNGELCGKSYSHALSNDQMLQCCVQTIHSRPSTGEGKHAKTLVVGTHRDLESACSETRVEKNRMLVKMLKPILQDELVLYSPRLQNPEVIFPINTQTPAEQDHQVCALIRKQVEDKKRAPPPYKIPIGWFLLEQDIIKASNSGVISKKECIGIASLLNIDAEALTAALKYFDDLNIFLYYPSVLPEVVFSDPQVLLNKVTELVQFSYSLRSDNPPLAVEGTWLQFRDKGIVTLDMFQDDRFPAHYIPGLFFPADLIELFKHLLIIAPISNKEYFMPSLLRMISSEEFSKLLPPSSSSAAPLLVHFPAGCAQNGVFCAVVVYLLSKCQWKFAHDIEGNPLCVSRSCVCFKFPDKPASIVLLDSFTYFEVHIETRDTLYPKVCPMIRDSIFSGLKVAAKTLRYNNSTPVPAFFCKCTDSPPHAATPVIEDDDCYLMCAMTHNDSGPLMKQHSVWLGVKLPIADTGEGNDGDNETPPAKKHPLPVAKGNDDDNETAPAKKHPLPVSKGCEIVAPPPKRQRCDTANDQADRPTLIECIRFRGRERRINIPQEIGIKYRDFGLFLLDDPNGVRIRALAHKHNNDANEINIQIIEEWVAGKGKHPVTWKTLTEVLHDIELSTLAEEIEAVKS